jgi:Fur family transcriptional regulator, ferric uptake regulator
MSIINRKTPARTAIFEFLGQTKTPVGVSDILEYLRSKDLKTNKVTVYRNLESMYGGGFLEKFEFGEGKFRYEIKKEHHHHLICTECGDITDVPGDFLDKFENEIKDKKEFLVKSHSLEFFGLCKNCQE